MKLSYLLSATALFSTLPLAMPAMAQVPVVPEGNKVPSSTTQSPLSDESQPTNRATNTTNTNDDDGAVVVVGSRIRRSNYNTAEPITVLTRDEATLAGFNSATDALQSTGITNGASQINNAYGGFVTNGGPGANTLSLRGLGAERTLILLNGRRVAPAGSRGSVGAADLNVLPTAMIDRIEVLKSGASSVYGSDAVAGVVNIVTRSNVQGLTLEGQHNITQDGGGNTQRYSAVAGWNSDRLHISGSLEYYKRDDLTLGDRDWTRCNTDYRRTATNRTPGSGDYIDPRTGQPKCYPITGTGSNGVTINTIGTSTVAAVPAPGTVTTTFNRLRPNAAITTGVAGYEGVGGGTNNLNVRDTFDPRMLNRSLISPVEVYTGYLQGSYETGVLGNAEVYGELLLNRRKSSQVGYRQLSLDYIKGSPLIPANLAFSTFGPAGTSLSNPTAVVGVRAFIGAGNDKSNQTVDYAKIGGGVRGDINLLPDWRYDAYASRTWSDASYTSQQFLSDRLGNSLNVATNTDGTFRCANPVGNCVAAPSLSAGVVGGQLPAAWLNYVFVPDTGTTKYRETVVNVAVNGPLFTLPGGPVQLVLGGEYRNSKIDDTPSINSQSGNLYNFSASLPTRGSDRVLEAFGELEVPLIRNRPFFEDLTVSASGRYTDYRSYGSNETYKFGGVWSPARFLSFRGSYGTSYRAPALFEQFLGATSGFLSQTNDPCYEYGQAGVGAVRAANCASEGLAPTFQQNSSIRSFAGGGAATGLAAETSRSWTAGGVLQPKFGDYGSLSIAADYFDTKVSNGVARAGATAILSRCYDDPDFRNGGAFCRLVTRDPSTNVLTVNDNYVNLSEDNVRGIDITGRYTVKPFGDDYTFRIGAQVTKYFEQSNRLFPDDPLDEYNGSINVPDWTGTFEAAVESKVWRVRYGLEWIKGTQSYDLYGLDSATTPFVLDVPDYYLHSLTAQITATDRFGFTFGVRNLTNAKPPSISSGLSLYNRVGNAPLYSGYDYFGRQFFVNVSAKF